MENFLNSIGKRYILIIHTLACKNLEPVIKCIIFRFFCSFSKTKYFHNLKLHQNLVLMEILKTKFERSLAVFCLLNGSRSATFCFQIVPTGPNYYGIIRLRKYFVLNKNKSKKHKKESILEKASNFCTAVYM